MLPKLQHLRWSLRPVALLVAPPLDAFLGNSAVIAHPQPTVALADEER